MKSQTEQTVDRCAATAMSTGARGSIDPFSRSDPQLGTAEEDRIGENYRGLVDSADEAMVVVDTTGSIALVNGRAEQLFGYSRQELLGHNIKMLVPQRFHENHDAHCKSYTGHPRLREMGSGVQILGCRRNGTEFPAEISLSPVDIGGEPFVSAAIRDITDNKRLEFLASHFVAVIESSHDAIIGRDLDGLVTSWNRGAELLFGYPDSEMLGQPISLLDEPGEDDHWRQHVFDAEKLDTVCVRKDGTLVDVSITNSPICGSNGAMRGWSTIARDISDRRKAEEIKDGFLTLVSHELRTPLSAIVAHVELLLDERLSEHRARFVEVIHRNSVRLERLVGDLLFVAQLDSAGLTVKMDETDIVAVAREAVEAATPRARQFGVDLHFEAREESVSLLGDAGRLGQALDNIVSNAIKYSPEGGAVRVRLLPGPTEVTIEVQDHGMGIALDEQEHLFERFFRASTAVDLHIQGVGLGLMVVKTIIEAHGGRVSVQSQPGSGTTFGIVLPLGTAVRELVPTSIPISSALKAS